MVDDTSGPLRETSGLLDRIQGVLLLPRNFVMTLWTKVEGTGKDLASFLEIDGDDDDEDDMGKDDGAG